MALLALYWSFMIIGYIIAWQMRKRGKTISWIQSAMMGTIYFLCLIMGLRMGVNEQVISNLGSIGLMSLIITIFCVAGSMAAIFVMRKIFRMDRYGNILDRDHGKHQEINIVQVASGHIEMEQMQTGDVDVETEKKENKLDLRSTFIILAFVAGGMVLGALIISKSSILLKFDSISYYALIVLLCILLLFVGFDLGASGTILSSIKTVGFKIIGFPIAAVIGTIIVGTLTCIIMGFSFKEGLAICLGFGWYTYAPVVIAGAGQQYMIASAVSFMHNVIRETAGIIFIPIIAKKIGYLESTGVPGVAAMDVCMPIIQRSCRTDTVLYSFATGLLMCLVTSVGVPLVMGL